MTLLAPEEVRRLLDAHPAWELRDQALHRDLVFADFAEAFSFMTAVALVAERLHHHPDWSNSWNQVSMAVASHEQGGVTAGCFALVTAIDQIADRRSG